MESLTCSRAWKAPTPLQSGTVLSRLVSLDMRRGICFHPYPHLSFHTRAQYYITHLCLGSLAPDLHPALGAHHQTYAMWHTQCTFLPPLCLSPLFPPLPHVIFNASKLVRCPFDNHDTPRPWRHDPRHVDMSFLGYKIEFSVGSDMQRHLTIGCLIQLDMLTQLLHTPLGEVFELDSRRGGCETMCGGRCEGPKVGVHSHPPLIYTCSRSFMCCTLNQAMMLASLHSSLQGLHVHVLITSRFQPKLML